MQMKTWMGGFLSKVGHSRAWMSLAMLMLFTAGTQVQAADFTAWSYNMPLILNTYSTGANVATTQTNFPVLVRLNSTNFNFALAKSDGSDIRFGRTVSGTTNELNCQIERWDATNHVAEVWVLVDQINGNDPSQSITMYWGNASATFTAANAVFTSANNFQAVYHISESPGTTAGGFKDATGVTAHNATGTGMPANMPSPGIIGNAQWFDGLEDYISIPTLPNSATATVSAWYQMDALQANMGIVSNGQWTTGVCHFKNNAGPLVSTANGGGTLTSSTQTTGDTQWYLGTYTYSQSGTVLKMYVNGNLVGTSTTPNAQWVGTNLQIAHEYTDYSHATTARFFAGEIDEARIENTVRSADWIKLCYQNQNANQNLVQIQNQAPSISIQPTDKSNTAGQSVTFTSLATGVPGPSYQWQRKVNNVWTNITGATGANYTFTTASSDNGAQFQVVVSATGSVTSSPATLTVNYAPQFANQPLNQNVLTGQTATFTALAVGNPAPTYQWRKNGVNISGATSASYSILTNATNNQATYSVVAINSVAPSGIISNNATLTVSSQPNSNPPDFAFNFDEGDGTVTSNSGTVGGNTSTWTSYNPVWSTRAPINGTNSVNFGTTPGNYAIDFSPTDNLSGLTSFTITGWLNLNANPTGAGGNRIVSWLPGGANNSSGDGVELVVRNDKSLGLGINQWNDNGGVGSSASKITMDANGSFNNWVFFAVTYDGTISSNNVKFYFGSNGTTATLDATASSSAGSVGTNISSVLTLGNLVPSLRPTNTTQMFPGSLDQIHIYTSKNDASGAKSPAEIATIQNAAPVMGRAGILYEQFDAIGGGTLKDIVAAPAFPDNPSATLVRQSFDAPVNQGTNYGVKMSGWVQAPLDGNYTFWIAADDQAELRLSTDANPMNKVIIASVPAYTGAQEWNKYPNQQSGSIFLNAGKLYFIEALMSQGTGSANLSVGWQLPPASAGAPGAIEQPIPAGRLFLTPNEGDAFFPSAINLYEKGTSNKKATLGWSKEAQNEHFYIQTEGSEKLKIKNSIVSVPEKLYLGGGDGTINDLGFQYNTGTSTPSLDVGTGDGRKAFTIQGVVGHELDETPIVDFNKGLNIKGDDWTDSHNFIWTSGAAFDYRDGFFTEKSHPGITGNQTTESQSVAVNTDNIELVDNSTATTPDGVLTSTQKSTLSSQKFTAAVTSTGGLHSSSTSVEVDPVNGISYASEIDGQKTLTKISSAGVATSELVLTPKWKVGGLTVPDYVFEKGYHLQSLEETEKYVNANKHLPDVPAAKEMEDKGINITEMNLKLLKKVEELTLHMIVLDKSLKEQEKKNQRLEDEVKSMRNEGKGK